MKKSYYAFAAILLFIIEFLIATQFKHLHFVRAYLSDFLVVILLYCVTKSLFNVPAAPLVWAVFALSLLVEFAQYFHIADHLQLTGTLRVIVGTSFSVYDIVMYALGCLVAYSVDRYLQRRFA